MFQKIGHKLFSKTFITTFFFTPHCLHVKLRYLNWLNVEEKTRQLLKDWQRFFENEVQRLKTKIEWYNMKIYNI